MMRQIRTLFLLMGSLLMLAPILRAQESKSAVQKPDNELILQSVLNGESPNYYPALMMRYRAGDTTLTLDNYRHLYYGYVWQPEYQPFETPTQSSTILSILERGIDSLTQSDYERLRDLSLEVIDSNPFSPSNINFLILAYGALGDTVNERINYHRLKMLFETIKSSGTGLKESNPWHVTDFSHASDVMGTLNLAYGKRMVVSRTTEYIPLSQRIPGAPKGYYFDFSRLYMFRPDKIPERKPTGWEFNGLPIKKR